MNKLLILEKDNELPKGWEKLILDKVITRISNGTSEKQSKDITKFPVSRIETISNEYIDFNKVRWIKNPSKEFVEKYRLKNGDILFSNINSDSHLGKSTIFKEDRLLLHGMNLLLIRPNQEIIIPKFLNYLFKHYRNSGGFILIAQHAVNQSSINQTKLKNIELLFPPLNEQKKIVTKIEELFSKLDKSLEYIQLLKKQIKLFERTIVQNAIFGNLTEKYRKNNRTSSLKNVLNEIEFSKKKIKDKKLKQKEPKQNDVLPLLPNSWKWIRLGFLSDLITKGSSPKWQGIKYVKKGVLFITSENVRLGRLNLKEEKFLEPKFNVLQKRSILKKGDLLTNIVGASIGRSAIFNQNVKANINQAVALTRLTNQVKEKYILIVLNSAFILDIMHREKVDVARANLSLQDVSDFPIPLPPIEEQISIIELVEKYNSLNSINEKLMGILNKKIFQTYSSILKKSFEGKLVPQDPNDEPVSELLKKIKATVKN